MTETNQGEKKTLTLTLKSDQKKGSDAGKVQQSFSHGRTKSVAVEVKKKRTPNANDIKQAQKTAKVVASGKLTEGEFGARMKALQEAMKNQSAETEEKARRDAFDVVRRQEQEKLVQQQEELKRLEEEARLKKESELKEQEEKRLEQQRLQEEEKLKKEKAAQEKAERKKEKVVEKNSASTYQGTNCLWSSRSCAHWCRSRFTSS